MGMEQICSLVYIYICICIYIYIHIHIHIHSLLYCTTIIPGVWCVRSCRTYVFSSREGRHGGPYRDFRDMFVEFPCPKGGLRRVQIAELWLI